MQREMGVEEEEIDVVQSREHARAMQGYWNGMYVWLVPVSQIGEKQKIFCLKIRWRLFNVDLGDAFWLSSCVGDRGAGIIARPSPSAAT
jgi:hypothetical protein